jgi:F0F1-type ATP synthase assembly protein I
MDWAARVTTIALVFVVPPSLGAWADRSWGTGPWLAVSGAILGFAAGMSQLLRLAKEPPRS